MLKFSVIIIANKMNQKTVGIILILLTAIMWALDPVVAKLSYVNSDYLHLMSIRVSVVSLIAFFYVLITNKSSFKVTRTEFSALLTLAIAASIIAEMVYYYALAFIPVVNTTILAHTQPIFIVIVGYFFLKHDKLTKFDYIGIFLMIIAIVFLITGFIFCREKKNCISN